MDTKKRSTKKSFSLTAAVITLALLCAGVMAVFCLCGLIRTPRVKMDKQLELHLVRGENHLDMADGAPLQSGDLMIAETTLHALDQMEESMLCFRASNCVVTVSIGGEERAVFGNERYENKQQIGDILVKVPLKEEDWGKELQIDFFCVEGEADSSVQDVWIIPSAYAATFPFIAKETKLLFFLALSLCGGLLLIASIVHAFRRVRTIELLLLALFLLSGSAYVLGRSGFLAVLLRRDRLSSSAGIFAAYLVPATFFAYYALSCMEAKKVRKRVFGLFAVAFFAAFGAALVLHFMQGTHAAAFLPYLRYGVLGAALYTLFAELFCGPPSSRNDDFPAKLGIVFAAIVLVLDFLRRNFYRSQMLESLLPYFPKLDYPALAILVLGFALMIHQYIRISDRSRFKENRELMKHLSYTDILSGIPNRHYCDRKLVDLGRSVGFQGTPVDYTLFFMDVNSLREVNESKGYEVGDELLRCVAEAVSDAMRGCGADERAGRIIDPDEEADPETKDCFYGRWGGDEFIACTFRSQADAFETTLMSRIAAINIEKRIPVDVSLSLGSCDLSSGSYERVLESLVKADRAMYDRKRQYHASHSPESV